MSESRMRWMIYMAWKSHRAPYGEFRFRLFNENKQISLLRFHNPVMKLEDNICPICLYIFIEPVTMPCKHELCLTCFKQNVQEANFCCPMCRVRISTWARKAARNNTLVNEEKWSAIKAAFPKQVKSRLEGLETEDEEMNALNISIKLAEPGEIRNEYIEQMKKLQEQRAEERRCEQEASEMLIRQIQEEERKNLEELEAIEKQDEELAKKLSQINESEVFTRSSSARDSNSSSLGTMLDKLRDKTSPCVSPFHSTNIAPEGRSKSIDREQLRKKIKHDENLITTQDIEMLEESFKKSTPYTEHNRSCILKVQTPTGHMSLHRKEILDQMTDNICIALDDEESNQSTVTLNPKPVLPVDSPALHNTSMSDDNVFERSRSADSISHELNHFRPIRSCPLTPPRRLPSGQVVEPLVIRTTPRNLNKSALVSPSQDGGELADIDAGSPIMRRRLSELAEERKDKVTKLSKSTSTVSGMIVRPDENRNPDGATAESISSTPPTVGSRNVNFKDISNSRHLSSKNQVITDDVACVKKKLIIPLEPDLTENEDFVLTDPLGHSSPVIDRTSKVHNKSNETGRLSRKRKLSKREYSESPQCSLMKWARPVDTMQDVKVSEAGGSNSVCESQSLHVNTSELSPLANRTRRTVRRVINPDYLYGDFKKKVTGKLDSSGESNEMVEGNSDSESGSDSEQYDILPSKRQKLSSSPRKERQNHTCNSKSNSLKHVKGPQRATKAIRKKGSLDSKKTATKTMHDFFPQKVREDDLTQEEKDRKMAEQLQKQFEMEAKYSLTSIRFKGTSEQYLLRKGRRKNSVK